MSTHLQFGSPDSHQQFLPLTPFPLTKVVKLLNPAFYRY
jgi:hypothetical protein